MLEQNIIRVLFANNSLYDNDTMIFMTMAQCSVSSVALGDFRDRLHIQGLGLFLMTSYFFSLLL